MVRGGASGASAGSCSFHIRSDDEEGGGEMVHGLGERGTRVADGEGNELHPSPVSSEGRNEEGVFLCLFLDLNVATEVPTETDLYDDEGALFLVERGRVGGGIVWDPSYIDEVWSCVMSGLEQRLGLSRQEDPIVYAAGCHGALCVSVSGGITLVAVYGVLGDIGVATTADVLRRG